MGGKWKVTDSMTNKRQKYEIAVSGNVGNLAGMDNVTYVSLFHCASSK